MRSSAHSRCAADLGVRVALLYILQRRELAGQVTELEASSAQRDLDELEIELLPVRPVEDRVWQLRHNFTCYDAWLPPRYRA